MANGGLTLHMERRKCEYRDHNTLKMRIGHCLLIHGNGGGLAYAVIEKNDGLMEDVLIDNVRFLDIAPWADIQLEDGCAHGPIKETTHWIPRDPMARSTPYLCAKCESLSASQTPYCCNCGRRAPEVDLPK